MPELNDYSFRAIEEKDLGKVLAWRNSERIRAGMYTDHIITMEEHLAWFKRLKKDNNSICMIFEYLQTPAGVVNITQIDRKNNKCHWGFYLGETGLPAKSGLVMGYFAFEYIFEVLGIRKLTGEALVSNAQSVKYHKKLGFVEEGRLVKHVLKNSSCEDVITMAVFKENWMELKMELGKICFNYREKS